VKKYLGNKIPQNLASKIKQEKVLFAAQQELLKI